MVGKTLSHYRILAELGRGGMGIVYKAEDTKLRRTVAIKVLPESALAKEEERGRFFREAQAAAQLNHPNIATVYEVNDVGEFAFIAMEYVEGESLTNRIAGGSLETEEVESISRQLVDALSEAHSKGIVHRDIKPDNIMLGPKDRVKVLDFGLAKMTDGIDLTRSGMTLGTVHYMSPEQVRGESVDWRSDAWSLGVVIYEMLTGRKPFEGSYEAAVFYQILNEEPEPLAKGPEKLISAVMRWLQKDADCRGESLSIAGSESPLPTQSQVVKTRSTELRIDPRAVLVTAVLLVSAVAVWLLSQSSVSESPRHGYAVLPLRVQGDAELSYLGEVAADALSTWFDAVENLQAVDANSVHGYVQRARYDVLDPIAGRDVADHFNAAGFVLGSLQAVGGERQIKATLYGNDDEIIGTSTQRFASDTLLFSAVDQVARELISEHIGDEGTALSSLGARYTSDFNALRSFLEGEMAVKRGEGYSAGAQHFRRAVEIDSTFALGWFRLGEFGGRSNQDLFDISARAMRYRAALPARLQMGIELQRNWFTRRLQKADSVAHEILLRFPFDSYAWFMRGEIKYHFASHFGDHYTTARGPLLQALERDPDNPEILTHLVELDAEEGRFDVIDTLAADTPLYLINGPPQFVTLAQRTFLSQIDKLGSSIPEIRIDAIQRVIAQDPGNGRLIEEGINWIDTYLEDIDLAEQLIDQLPGEGQSGFSPFRFFQVRAGLHAASEGRLADAQAAFDAAYEIRSWETEDEILGWLPIHQVPAERLEWLRSKYRRFNYSEWVYSEREVPFVYEYTDGLIGWMESNPETIKKAIAAMDTLSATGHELEFGRSLKQRVEGLLAFTEGRFEDAVTAFDEAVVPAALLEPRQNSPIVGFIVERFVKAEALYRLGDLTGSLRWLEALGDGDRAGVLFLGFMRFLAPSYRLRGMIYDELGNTDEAIHYYSLFVKHWANADDHLQPMVQEAQARIDALVESTISESGD